MKFVKKNVLIATIVILGLCVSSAGVMAVPVVEVTIDPVEPEPLSTVTINATITSEDDIDEVFLRIKECRDDFCYLDKDFSMTEIAPGEYQVNVTLEHSDANNIGYQLVINSNGTWYNFFTPEDMICTYLKTTSSDGQQDDGGDGTGTPGFELVLMIVSIAIIVFMLQRKR